MTELNNNDRASPTALKLKEIYLERLALLRRQNDNDMDEHKTIRLRGRIAECKKFLKALGQDIAQTPPATDAD